MRLLSGDRLASSVLDQVRPYRPNFILRGPVELLRKLDGARPGAHVTITGTYRSGMRDLLVGSLEVDGGEPAKGPDERVPVRDHDGLP